MDYIVVEFPAGASNFTGEMASELVALVDAGIIRVIDIVILTKNEDGTVDAVELSDVGVASLCDCSEERIRILSVQDSALVNALQRRAAVVLQKSLREGFGLTVTEAMWKGAAVIGGNVGGIKHQIENGVNGFLVDNVEQAADRIVDILKDPALRDRVGRNATETVKRRFLMTRLMEDWLDLLGSFQAQFQLKGAIQS